MGEDFLVEILFLSEKDLGGWLLRNERPYPPILLAPARRGRSLPKDPDRTRAGSQLDRRSPELHQKPGQAGRSVSRAASGPTRTANQSRAV